MQWQHATTPSACSTIPGCACAPMERLPHEGQLAVAEAAIKSARQALGVRHHVEAGEAAAGRDHLLHVLQVAVGHLRNSKVGSGSTPECYCCRIDGRAPATNPASYSARKRIHGLCAALPQANEPHWQMCVEGASTDSVCLVRLCCRLYSHHARASMNAGALLLPVHLQEFPEAGAAGKLVFSAHDHEVKQLVHAAC
jgi:hypothetical protein